LRPFLGFKSKWNGIKYRIKSRTLRINNNVHLAGAEGIAIFTQVISLLFFIFLKPEIWGEYVNFIFDLE
jgi:hypothetical protein